MKKIGWMSGGVSSFISCYLERKTIDEYIYIHIPDQHEDTLRFIKDCEKYLGTIKVIGLDKSVEEIIRETGVIKLPMGYAPCTNQLKKQVRYEWEKNQAGELTYVWGIDIEEKHRAERMIKNDKAHKHIFPLIERKLSKQQTHALCESLGIRRPMMYELGYSNNNCIGCVKGGMGYWNKIRKDFPKVFEQRAKLEREVGHSILKECYLDELDENRGRNNNKIPTQSDLTTMMILEEL